VEIWKRLGPYFQGIEKVKNEVKPMLETLFQKDGVVIVTAVNSGQADLLINWICSAGNHIDGDILDRLIVFCMDEEMARIATHLGVAHYYSKEIMGAMPSESAQHFNDAGFKSIMFGKMVAPQIVSMLGYDFLYCDVDIVWYKDPVPYLLGDSNKKWDMMFQDDGKYEID